MSEYLKNLFSLEGKTALVTGGGGGIGYSITQALSRAGAKVFIASRKMDTLQAATDQISSEGGLCTPIEADLSAPEGIEGLATAITEQAKTGLDILVNNAGATWGAPLGEFPWKAWQRVMGLNVASGFHLTQALLPTLKKSATIEGPSRVVFVGSVAGTRPVAHDAYSYTTSKSAVHHLTKVLSHELASDKITVNAIAPGPFKTKMTAYLHENEALREQAAKQVPIGRFGSEEDIAGTIIPLVSKAGSYISGAIIPVDGGISALP